MEKTGENYIKPEDFFKVKIQAGTIISAEVFEGVKKPAYKLKVDLGQDGIKQSSAQITDLYKPEDLIGIQVICITNLPPKQVKNFISEILVTGFYNESGQVVLARPDSKVPDGTVLC